MKLDFAHRATKKIVGFIIAALIFVPLALFVFGEIVLHLWNWLMPTLFHLPMITLWQAMGLMVLSWLLFGRLRGFHGHHSGNRSDWRRRMQERMRERWEEMTPEERDKFREWIQSRCGDARSDAEAKT